MLGTNDLSEVCDEAIVQSSALLANGNFSKALEILFTFEKQTRLSADSVSNARLLVAMARACFQAKRFDDLNENVLAFTKKKCQSKEAIKTMIGECLQFVEKLEDKREKVRLIETLRDASEGKIYLEIERARLTKTLADIRESDADVDSAVVLMEKLQIDSYGSMDKGEKVEFIIAQMRLLVKTGQQTKAQIISKRINPSFFKPPENHDLKQQFYHLMIEVDREERLLKTAEHYLAMYDRDVETVENARTLRSAVLYCLLAPHSNEQRQTLVGLSALLSDDPYRDLVKLFLNQDLIDWSEFLCVYKGELASFPFFDTSTTYGIKCWKELRTRTIDHNIRTFASYYVRIRLARMSELLVLSDSETEKHLTRLICDGNLRAKIDRPAGIVYFNAALQTPEERLNTWATELMKLMALLTKTNHLINAATVDTTTSPVS